MTAYVIPGLRKPEEIIAEEFGATVDELKSRSRVLHIKDARNVAMWYYRNFQKMSYAGAALLFERDHCTAIWAVRKVDDLYKTDKEFRRRVISALRRIDIKNEVVNS